MPGSPGRGKNREKLLTMNVTKKSLQRIAAGVGALAIVLGGSIGAATAAYADVPSAGTAPGDAAAGSTGTLTVHKRAGTAGAAGNGTELTSPAGSPLGGIAFTAQQVGTWDGSTCVAIDLTTSAGWDAAQAANGAKPAAPAAAPATGDLCNYGQALTQTTADGTGATTFGDLNLGLYYVVEQANANVAEAAAPFYVTVPFSSNSGTEAAPVTTWLYDVHVYPKNSVVDAPTKTIGESQADLVVGADVTWTISQVIPTLTESSSKFTDASVSDVLDSRLAYKSSVVEIVGNGSDVLLVEGTDYNRAGNVAWTLTDSGLALLDARQGSTLRVTLTSTVTSVTAENETAGSISNLATVTINNKPRTTPEVYTYWGNLKVTKHDSTVTGTPLSGAEFQVFDNAAGTTCPALPASGALATGTSNNAGVVVWTRADQPTPTVTELGLWIANSNSVIADPTKGYCLYETVAPTGYAANTSGELVTIGLTDNALLTKPVVNTKVPGPALPLTGSTGTLMLSVAGLALVGVGGATVLLRRKFAKRA